MSDRKVYQPVPWAVIFWTKREQLASSKTWSINWRSLDSVDWNTFAAPDGVNQPLRRVRLTRVFCSCGLSLLKQTSRQTFIFSSSGTTGIFCKCSKLSSGGEQRRCSKRFTRSSCEDIKVYMTRGMPLQKSESWSAHFLLTFLFFHTVFKSSKVCSGLKASRVIFSFPNEGNTTFFDDVTNNFTFLEREISFSTKSVALIRSTGSSICWFSI